VLCENASKYRDGNGFLTTGGLQAYWDAFIGARPQGKPTAASAPSGRQPRASQQDNSRPGGQPKKRKWPATDICNKFNTGNCQKAPGACYDFRGRQMCHVCNWRDLNAPNATPCGLAHMRVGNH